MKKSLFRFLATTMGSGLAIVALVCVFNLWLFSYSSLNTFISPNDALFLEGLLTLVLGVLVLLNISYAKSVGGRRQLLLGSGLTHADSWKSKTDNTRVVGLALLLASVTLFLLHFQGIH